MLRDRTWNGHRRPWLPDQGRPEHRFGREEAHVKYSKVQYLEVPQVRSNIFSEGAPFGTCIGGGFTGGGFEILDFA